MRKIFKIPYLTSIKSDVLVDLSKFILFIRPKLNPLIKTLTLIKKNIIYILFFPVFFVLVALLEIEFFKYFPSLDSPQPENQFLYWVFTILLTWFLTKLILSKIIFPLISNLKNSLRAKKRKYTFKFNLSENIFVFIIINFLAFVIAPVAGMFVNFIVYYYFFTIIFFLIFLFFNRKYILSSIVSIFFLIILVFLLTNRKVNSRSMLPTLQPGEYINCQYFDKNNNNLNYRDIIVFKHQKKYQEEIQDNNYIKRIIALPGDKVIIKDYDVFINGNLLLEEYINEPKSTNNWENGFTKEGEEITVPQKKYFVLGDNRRISSDSREFGFVSEDDISCVISWKEQEKYKKRWRPLVYSEKIIVTPTIQQNNNEINSNTEIKNQQPSIDLDYVQRILNITQAARDNWLTKVKGRVPESEFNNFINSLNIIIDFCKTLLSRLDKSKIPSQDDIYMYNSIIKLKNESVAESKRLVEKYSLNK
jgi:signal peptidase I